MSIIGTPYKTVEQPMALHRGAPKPWVLERMAGGVLIAWPATTMVRVTYGKNLFYDLTVGDGITLSASLGVANARATIRHSPAQSRLCPKGLYARYEIQLGAGAAEEAVMMGPIDAQGGDNPDV